MSDVRQTLTIAETAEILGMGRATAYELLRRDEFPVPVIRFGRKRVVSRRVLDRLLDGGPGVAVVRAS